MLPEKARSAYPYHVTKGTYKLAPFSNRHSARATMMNLDDTVRRDEGLKPYKSPHHIQYTHVPDDVIRYEDLFDYEITQQVIRLLQVKESLQEFVEDFLRTSRTISGELGLRDVYTLIEELDDRDKLEGLTIRRVCVPDIQSYLIERMKEDDTELSEWEKV